jgi:hypothetical protein
MGMDFAIFLPMKHVDLCLKIIKQSGFSGIHAGYIERGPKQVIIKPKNIVFEGKTLEVRYRVCHRCQ